MKPLNAVVEWVAVDERLPMEGEFVTATEGNQLVLAAWKKIGPDVIWDGFAAAKMEPGISLNITHWLHIEHVPEPPFGVRDTTRLSCKFIGI